MSKEEFFNRPDMTLISLIKAYPNEDLIRVRYPDPRNINEHIIETVRINDLKARLFDHIMKVIPDGRINITALEYTFRIMMDHAFSEDRNNEDIKNVEKILRAFSDMLDIKISDEQ